MLCNSVAPYTTQWNVGFQVEIWRHVVRGWVWKGMWVLIVGFFLLRIRKILAMQHSLQCCLLVKCKLSASIGSVAVAPGWRLKPLWNYGGMPKIKNSVLQASIRITSGAFEADKNQLWCLLKLQTPDALTAELWIQKTGARLPPLVIPGGPIWRWWLQSLANPNACAHSAGILSKRRLEFHGSGWCLRPRF